MATKPNASEKAGTEDEMPVERRTALEVLLAISGKLEEIVQWDLSGLDAQDLDASAKQCITFLEHFLLKDTMPMGKKAVKKRKVKHAA